MNKAKPVLQWLLHLSENDLDTVTKIVNKWEKIPTQLEEVDIRGVENGLIQISSHIASADEHNIKLQHWAQIGRILMKLSKLTCVLKTHPIIHRNLLRCLVQMNRCKFDVDSNRLKAKDWSLKLIRHMTRTSHSFVVCREVGFTAREINVRLKIKTIRSYSELVGKCSSTVAQKLTSEQQAECLLLISDLCNNHDDKSPVWKSTDALEDAIKCLSVMVPCRERTEILVRIHDWLREPTTNDSGEARLSPNTLPLFWCAYAPSLERELLRLVDEMMDPSLLPCHVRDRADESKLLRACAEKKELYHTCMKMISVLFPVDCRRYGWIPTLINRVIVDLNPSITSGLPPALQPLILFLHFSPLTLPPSFSCHVIDSMSKVIRTHLAHTRTSRLYALYRDWYVQSLLLVIQRPTESYLTVAAWIRGYTIATIDKDMVFILKLLDGMKGTCDFRGALKAVNDRPDVVQAWKAVLADVFILFLITQPQAAGHHHHNDDDDDAWNQVLKWVTQSCRSSEHHLVLINAYENLFLVNAANVAYKSTRWVDVDGDGDPCQNNVPFLASMSEDLITSPSRQLNRSSNGQHRTYHSQRIITCNRTVTTEYRGSDERAGVDRSDTQPVCDTKLHNSGDELKLPSKHNATPTCHSLEQRLSLLSRWKIEDP